MSTLITPDGTHTFHLEDRVLTDDERAAAVADLIERLMPTVAAGYRAEDPLTLAHEAERLEALAATPLIRRMRQLVADEQARRAGVWQRSTSSIDFTGTDTDA